MSNAQVERESEIHTLIVICRFILVALLGGALANMFWLGFYVNPVWLLPAFISGIIFGIVLLINIIVSILYLFDN